MPEVDRSPTARFSDRADTYARHRPGYPEALYAFIQQQCGLDAGWQVVDIGSGTGRLSEGFLEAGCQVTGVEPNAAMRCAGERELASYPRFTSVDGTAESTGLQTSAYDLAVVGQALHWFRRDAARQEFLRILRRPAWTAIVWNERLVGVTPFLEGYERLLQAHCPEYREVDHRRIGPAELSAFYGHDALCRDRFEHMQWFDWEGLWGRVLSSSYVPQEGPGHEALHTSLRVLFDDCAEEGRVAFLYESQVTIASMKEAQ